MIAIFADDSFTNVGYATHIFLITWIMSIAECQWMEIFWRTNFASASQTFGTRVSQLKRPLETKTGRRCGPWIGYFPDHGPRDSDTRQTITRADLSGD